MAALQQLQQQLSSDNNNNNKEAAGEGGQVFFFVSYFYFYFFHPVCHPPSSSSIQHVIPTFNQTPNTHIQHPTTNIYIQSNPTSNIQHPASTPIMQVYYVCLFVCVKREEKGKEMKKRKGFRFAASHTAGLYSAVGYRLQTKREGLSFAASPTAGLYSAVGHRLQTKRECRLRLPLACTPRLATACKQKGRA